MKAYDITQETHQYSRTLPCTGNMPSLYNQPAKQLSACGTVSLQAAMAYGTHLSWHRSAINSTLTNTALDLWP